MNLAPTFVRLPNTEIHFIKTKNPKVKPNPSQAKNSHPASYGDVLQKNRQNLYR